MLILNKYVCLLINTFFSQNEIIIPFSLVANHVIKMSLIQNTLYAINIVQLPVEMQSKQIVARIRYMKRNKNTSVIVIVKISDPLTP